MLAAGLWAGPQLCPAQTLGPPAAPASASGTADLAADPDTAPPLPPPGPLGDALTPDFYRLDLTIDPAQPRFSGHVEIDARLAQPGRYVALHGRGLHVAQAQALVAGRLVPASYEQADDSGVALLTFAQPLPAGPLTLRLDYDAPFGQGPAGLFRVAVGDDWYAWSQFESTDARAAFPGIDQPSAKQPFAITIRTPPGQMAVSNAPETALTHENGLDVHHFATTAPLPTYLVALMAGPFAGARAQIPAGPYRPRPLPLRVIASRAGAGDLAYALANTAPILAGLEAYFAAPFPYPKLDLIATPILPGAMENAGADLFGDKVLLVPPGASPDARRRFGMVVAHELAHQWFGDLVTPRWWDDIWLNESFANWLGFRIGDGWQPDLGIAGGALAEGFAAMDTDALASGRPIRQTITDTRQIDAAFDSITYGKGAQVLAMLEAYVGPPAWRAGVRRFIAAHPNGNATSADFFAALAAAAGPGVEAALEDFTRQQGVPLLSFARTPGSAPGHYTVSQSRYALPGAAGAGAAGGAGLWHVPLCMARGAERRCQMLSAASTDIAFAPAADNAPLMPNAGGTGYYRFELPRAEWEALIARADRLPAGEVMALADSLMASFRAGRSDASALARLAQVGARHPDARAAGAALGGLMQLARGLLDPPASAAAARLIARAMEPQLAPLGFSPAAEAYAGEAPARTDRRALVVESLLASAPAPALRSALLKAAEGFLNGDASALDPQWYALGFDLWLGVHGRSGAPLLLARALASQDPLLRPALLQALAASGDSAIARSVLAAPRGLRPDEAIAMVLGITASRPTRDLGYGYMRKHLAQLLADGGGIFLARSLPRAFDGWCSAAMARRVEKDFGPALAARAGGLDLARALERMRACEALRNSRSADASAQILALAP